VSNAASVPERHIYFTEQFFDRLDLLLPQERQPDGTPSVTDFLLIDLPTVRDRLLADFEANTLSTDTPDVRVYLGAGALVRRFAIFASLDTDTIEAFWISLSISTDDDGPSDL
jgi:hypothetical protein